MAQLQTDDISMIYAIGGEQIIAVDKVSITIEKGEFVSLVGHSGSGKTTLLSIIGGIAKPSTGSVRFEGRDIYGLNSDGLSEYRSEKIGFMFQFASLLSVLTAKENLLLPVLFKPSRKDADGKLHEERAVELLNMVGLGDRVNAYPSQLSGGQQRRVAIARAFMNDPELILADEPTGDLDEETEADMMRFFSDMNKAKGVTFILVTHNTELASQAGRRMKMVHGKNEEH